MTRPDAPLVAFGYARLSTTYQAQHNNTLDQQAQTIRAYYDYKLRDDFAWGGVVEEPGVSTRTPLLQRPGGRDLNDTLQSGDVVIFSRLDRGFKDTLDLLMTDQSWRTKGVAMHVLDLNVDTSTDMGKFFLTVMAAALNLERQQTFGRFQAGIEHAKTEGWWPYPKAPYGYKIVKVRDKRGRRRQKLEPNPDQRRLGVMMWDMQAQGMATGDIAAALLGAGERARDGGRLNRTIVERYLAQEREFREKESRNAFAV